MDYVKIDENNNILKYPYNIPNDLHGDYPNISFPIDLTDEFLLQFNIIKLQEDPNKPSRNDLFNELLEINPILVDNIWTKQYEVRYFSIEDIKDILITKIKQLREQRELQGFMYNDKLIESDMKSIMRISNAAQLASLNSAFEVVWTCADNSELVLNASQMLEMHATFVMYIKSLHDNAKVLKSQVDAATTIDELKNINIV